MVFMPLVLVLTGQFCRNVTSNKYSDKCALIMSQGQSRQYYIPARFKVPKNHIDLYREIQNIGDQLDSFTETQKLLSQ